VNDAKTKYTMVCANASLLGGLDYLDDFRGRGED
jgi:hypothetical protein